jgi:undecaprenyl-diphosphatase
MQRSSGIGPPRQAVAAFLACAGAFAALAFVVFATQGLAGLDREATLYLAAQRRPALTALMRAVSWLHETWHLLAFTSVAAAALAWRGMRRWAVSLVVAVPGVMLLNVLLKNAFQRLRPEIGEPLVHYATYSFPSGHTTASTVLYGWLCAWVWAHTRAPGPRLAAALGGGAMVAAVALSRVYLGAHYLSDVTASMAVAGAWLALAIGTLRRT